MGKAEAVEVGFRSALEASLVCRVGCREEQGDQGKGVVLLVSLVVLDSSESSEGDTPIHVIFLIDSKRACMDGVGADSKDAMHGYLYRKYVRWNPEAEIMIIQH